MVLQNLSESHRISKNLTDSCRKLKNCQKILNVVSYSLRILQTFAYSYRISNNPEFLARSHIFLQNIFEYCRIFCNSCTSSQFWDRKTRWSHLEKNKTFVGTANFDHHQSRNEADSCGSNRYNTTDLAQSKTIFGMYIRIGSLQQVWKS